MLEMRLTRFTLGDQVVPPNFNVLSKTMGIRWSVLWRLCEVRVQEILPYMCIDEYQ